MFVVEIAPDLRFCQSPLMSFSIWATSKDSVRIFVGGELTLVLCLDVMFEKCQRVEFESKKFSTIFLVGYL